MDMNSFTINGLIISAIGLFVLVFQSLAGLMQKPEWQNLLLGDLSYDMWASISDKMPTGFMQNGFDYLVFELPLWILLVSIGVLCIIAGMFIKK
ncbi:MAG: hypothetical protein HQK62_12375 [Desulfamplus sp.]|nr:hypothetical protein [Desulfamplus sp.]